MNTFNEQKFLEISYSDEGIKNQYYERVPFEENVVATISNCTGSTSDSIAEIRNLTKQIEVEEDESKRKRLVQRKRELKSNLAHFSMAKFKDNYRSNENFESTEHFILDFDNVDDLGAVKKKFEEDDRTFFVFESVSGNGLKAGYWLDSTITNVNSFKSICKHYAKMISNEYGIEADTTFDAARACFISSDPNIKVDYKCTRQSAEVGETPSLADVKKQPSSESFLTRWPSVHEGERHTKVVEHTGECIQQGIPEDIACLTLVEWNKKNTPPLDEDEVVDTVKDVYKRYADDVNTFLWYDTSDKLKFSDLGFNRFLKKHGYYKYPLTKGYSIIRESGGLVELVEDHQLKETLINIISNSDKKNYLIQKTSTIIAKGKQDYLKTFDRKFNEDTKDKYYAYFTNGYFEVTKDGVTGSKNYSSLKDVIWKSKIIDRELRLNQDIDYLKTSEFYQLLEKITGGGQGLDSLISSIGYLCHTYFDPSLRKAIVTYDETHFEFEGVAAGGKGKSIIGQGLRYFVQNNTWIDGSKLGEIKAHTFQIVDPDTELIIIDDLVKKFDFGKLFASITEGVTVEKKYMHPFIVKNVKFFITSNFTLGGEGDSYIRRLHEIEIAPHYSLSFTPQDDFGHLLFEDWDDEQWNVFFNFMLHCVKTYLAEGIISYQPVHLSAKKIIENTSAEFYEYALTLELNVEYEKDEVWEKYRVYSNDREIKKNKFTRWVKIFAEKTERQYVEISGVGNRKNKFKLLDKKQGLKEPRKLTVPDHLKIKKL